MTIGKFASHALSLKYRGKIVTFEPVRHNEQAGFSYAQLRGEVNHEQLGWGSLFAMWKNCDTLQRIIFTKKKSPEKGQWLPVCFKSHLCINMS